LRDGSNQVRASVDLFPHRGAALSIGKIKDGHLQCPFHGSEFDPSGQCVLIPAIGRNGVISNAIHLKNYPTYEAHGLIWLCWGDPAAEELPKPELFDNLNETFHYGSARMFVIHARKNIPSNTGTNMIRRWMKKNNMEQVSHEVICQHIYKDKKAGGNLYRFLRLRRVRIKRGGHYGRRGAIPNRKSIDTRPAIVEARSRIGDWEADTIIGRTRSQAIVTLVERRSRFTIIILTNRNSHQSINALLIIEATIA